MAFLRKDLVPHYERLMQIKGKYPGRFIEELRLLWPRYSRLMDMSPDMKKLSVSREENRVRIYELADEWKVMSAGSEKDSLYRDLEKAVGKQIDLECRIRELRLDRLERRIGVLRKELDRFSEMRESIILGEIKKLTGSGREKG